MLEDYQRLTPQYAALVSALRKGVADGEQSRIAEIIARSAEDSAKNLQTLIDQIESAISQADAEPQTENETAVPGEPSTIRLHGSENLALTEQ
jgi:hypothetical protein